MAFLRHPKISNKEVKLNSEKLNFRETCLNNKLLPTYTDIHAGFLFRYIPNIKLNVKISVKYWAVYTRRNSSAN